MSISFMALAWKADMPSGRKLVLLALCDHANDQGECYPSVEAIARKCGMGQRTVQQHIGELESTGLLMRNFRKGRSTVYRLRPWHFSGTPDSAAPQASPLRGAASAALPPQLLPERPAVSAPISVTEPPPNHQVVRGMPLPSVWTLPAAWAQWALKANPAWTAAHVQFVAEKFRDHWTAVPGQRGIKADWLAAWRNWCRNEKPAGRTRQATQGGWQTGPARGDADGRIDPAAPHPGESYPAFIARVRRDQSNRGVAKTAVATPAAHNIAPTRSMISPANRAAALDAARALKSRLAGRKEKAHDLRSTSQEQPTSHPC